MTDVERLLRHLRLLIYLSPRTQREVERRAGFSKGYLSQVLCGNIELKYQHLITILEASRIEPSRFFRELFPRRGPHLERALDEFQGSSRPITHPLRVQLERLYGLGLESLADLCERLDRCEDAFSELEALGILERNVEGPFA